MNLSLRTRSLKTGEVEDYLEVRRPLTFNDKI